MLVWIIFATIVNGLVAFVGAFSLFVGERFLKKMLLVLVAFSAGGLLSGGMLHLLGGWIKSVIEDMKKQKE